MGIVEKQVWEVSLLLQVGQGPGGPEDWHFRRLQRCLYQGEDLQVSFHQGSNTIMPSGSGPSLALHPPASSRRAARALERRRAGCRGQGDGIGNVVCICQRRFCSGKHQHSLEEETRHKKAIIKEAINEGDTNTGREAEGEEEEGLVVEAEVLVLGAGMAGVTLAQRLKEEGVARVVVVEGSGRLGGRVKETKFGGITVELGANWVHRWGAGNTCCTVSIAGVLRV